MKIISKTLIFIGVCSVCLHPVGASMQVNPLNILLESHSQSKNETAKYLSLDNSTFAEEDELLDDPFIQIRSAKTIVEGFKSLAFPADASISHASIQPKAHLSKWHSQPQTEENNLVIANTDNVFDYRSPEFLIDNPSHRPSSEVFWEISNDSDFKYVSEALSGNEKFNSLIRISPLAETFFNNEEAYYLRVRSSLNSKWSTPFEFQVRKPEGISDVEFEKLDEDLYEICWDRYAEEVSDSIEYLVFGSNSLDFIPSIYSETQINEIVDGQVVAEDTNDNLVAITHDTKIHVPGTLAYYRIIVREKGQLSVPSRLVHVYDLDLVQPRNVLQRCEDESGRQVAKRVLIPSTYPWTATCLPKVNYSGQVENIFQVEKTILRTQAIPGNYVYNTFVPQEIWDKVSPYFLPENHPAKPKLDRLFSAKRVILSSSTFKKAGFKRYKPGRFSRIMASTHADFKNYFIKAFSDEELRITADWMKFIHRIKGASFIRAAIKKHGYEKIMKVPRKWIYPLPKDPSPPNSARYLRKNFILVAENMHTVGSEQNRKMYKKNMTKPLIEAIFNIFYEVGLWDSVFAFNVPFCKDGKLAYIDTEYFHKWPVPFHRMSRYLSSEMNAYLQSLSRKVPAKPEVN